jgi:hypothetical protein
MLLEYTLVKDKVDIRFAHVVLEKNTSRQKPKTPENPVKTQGKVPIRPTNT